MLSPFSGSWDRTCSDRVYWFCIQNYTLQCILWGCVGNDWRVVIAESEGMGYRLVTLGSSEAWGFDEGVSRGFRDCGNFNLDRTLMTCVKDNKRLALGGLLKRAKGTSWLKLGWSRGIGQNEYFHLGLNEVKARFSDEYGSGLNVSMWGCLDAVADSNLLSLPDWNLCFL